MAMDRSVALARLYDWNPWWRDGALEVPNFRRDLFGEIESRLEQPKAVVLAGLRQTGKTTLLLQLIAAKKGPDRWRRCLYLPLDQAAPDLERWGASLEDLLRLWSEEVAASPLGRPPTKYVFLDECHFFPGWAREVKGIVDRRWPARFVITGSAATTLQREAAKLLAGRAHLESLGPLTLRELVRARLDHRRAEPILSIADRWSAILADAIRTGRWPIADFEQTMVRFAPWKEEIASLTAQLLERGGFPEVAISTLDTTSAYRLMRTFLSMLVQRDFVEFFRVRDTRTLERLVAIMAQGTGRIFVERKLSSELGSAVNTIRNHLGFLKNAGLVATLRAYVDKAARAARLPEKFHFVDPGLRAALVGTGPEDRGFLLDSLVNRHLSAWAERRLPGARFAYWRQGDREVDLVLEHARRLIGIEVHARGSERRGLEAFRARYPSGLGWIVSEAATGRPQDARTELPLGLMLLLA
jgi:predicted AAA+ superfamily ATPase